MRFLDDIWEELPALIANDFFNGLDKRDACRIIYLASKNKCIKVKSFKTRICDIFRKKDNNQYEKYIISSHLFSLIPNLTSMFSLYFFLKHCLKRNISKTLLIILVIKTIIILPFSYLKRIKYFNLYF